MTSRATRKPAVFAPLGAVWNRFGAGRSGLRGAILTAWGVEQNLGVKVFLHIVNDAGPVPGAASGPVRDGPAPEPGGPQVRIH